MSKLNQTLRAELEKLTETFLEYEKDFMAEPHINGVKLNFRYNFKNCVDVKITVGRNLDNETE